MNTQHIDGSMGEGGGQVLRTSLTLSMCLQAPVVITNVRAGRAKPGLLRQHLAALRAAAEICGAQLSGDALGSTEVRFAPGALRAGTYEFRIGSAGSSTLLVQTVLPALALLDTPSTIVVHGGTHNGMAPSVDFLELSLFPLLKQMGVRVDSKLHRHGFYPIGGGRWEVTVHPWRQPAPLELRGRGSWIEHRAQVTSSQLQAHIAERELARVARKLGWPDEALSSCDVGSLGPGNIVSLRSRFEHVTEVFEAVGGLGISAERVAGRAIRDARRYLAAGYAVGEYLADQLLLPMVLGAGGEFTTGALSSHSRTNIALINRWLGAPCIAVSDAGGLPSSVVSIPSGLALAC